MSFGNYIKQLRTNKGLSLRETAKRANMSSSYLSQLENGHNTNPKKEILMNLSPVLDTSYIDLLMQTDLMNKHQDALIKNLSGDEGKITKHYEESKKLKEEHDRIIDEVKKLVKQGYTTNENAKHVYALENYLNNEVIVTLNGHYLTNEQKKEILNYAVYLFNK